MFVYSVRLFPDFSMLIHRSKTEGQGMSECVCTCERVGVFVFKLSDKHSHTLPGGSA